MRRTIKFSLLILFCVQHGFDLHADDRVSKTEKFRERVEQFYTALKASRWDEAKLYVLEKARSKFELEERGKLFGFRIGEIKIEEGGKSAVVEVVCKVPASFVGLLDIPRVTRWKFDAGDWFYDPEDPPQTLWDRIREYQNKGKSEVRFDRYSINFGVVEKGKLVNLRFPFTNLSSQEIKIEKVYLPNLNNFMQDSTKKVVFKPSEKGEVVIDLNTSDMLRDLDQTIFVEFQPIKEIIRLQVKGRIFEAKDLVNYKSN